ncbi:unnamed protein product [Caenorhabditis bovis]|uniref:G-protein coupled receptors family 1 profile domain-containing protein n=1 Tax=Caenorhabditis bovis TaxID=2654633 RepID=A0A8S1F778_9PELO|nr:unnamed protein product [Caenorhabditis bovis]
MGHPVFWIGLCFFKKRFARRFRQLEFQMRLIPYGIGLYYISNGVCRHFGPYVCYVGYSLMLHFLAHTLWSLLISFSYRCYVLYHPSPKGSTIAIILLIVYQLSFLQVTSFLYAYDDPNEIREILHQLFPSYNLTGSTISGTKNILCFSALYTILHMTLPIAPVYTIIILLRNIIIRKLSVVGVEMSGRVKVMHKQLLMALTYQALVPMFYSVAVASYACGQLGIMHHPVLEYMTFSSTLLVPVLAPLSSLIFVSPYRRFILLSHLLNTTAAAVVAGSTHKSWFSEESIEEMKESLVEVLYSALKPGSLISLGVYLVDMCFTIFHFFISHRISGDFTTIFLGTIYFPCIFLKINYIAEWISTAYFFRQINETINQIFNMTIILGCLAYNIMCTFVAKYQKPVPIAVSRAVFIPILLFTSFLVIAPKIILVAVFDKFFQFATQLFGSTFLIMQICVNIYKFAISKEYVEAMKKDEKTAENQSEVVSNARGRIVWASVFSFVLVVLTIPQIVDYLQPLEPYWITYHFLIQSISQLNSLFLSVAVFLILPTYRTAVFGGLAKIGKSKKASISPSRTVEPSVIEEPEKTEQPRAESEKTAVKPRIVQKPTKFGQHLARVGEIRIYMAPVHQLRIDPIVQ